MKKITITHINATEIKEITGYYYHSKNDIHCIIWKNWFDRNKWYVNELETGNFFGITANTIKGAKDKIDDLCGKELEFWQGKFSAWEKINTSLISEGVQNG